MSADASRVVLSIGSNIGDRLAMLQSAVTQLCSTAGVAVVAVSSVYETDPVGGPDQEDYLNAVVLIETSLEPEDLLARTQQIENELHRRREVRWGPRTVDIDVIDFAGQLSSDPKLTLPHPRAKGRAFVLVPWDECDSAASFPGGANVADILEALPLDDRLGVRLRGDLSLLLPDA